MSQIPDIDFSSSGRGNPPPPPEAAAPERREAPVIAHIGTAQVTVDSRPDFARLSDPARDSLLGGRTPNSPAVGSVLAGENGVFFATHTEARDTPEGHRAASTSAATTMRKALDLLPLDGEPDSAVASAFHFAAGKADEAVAAAKQANGDSAEASVGVVRLFRGEGGKNKAALFGAGDVTILRIRGTDENDVLIHPQADPGGRPTNAFEGNGRNGHDQVKVVDVQPGDRFVVVDGAMQEGDDFWGIPIEPDAIGAAARSAGGPNDAAEAISRLPIRNEGMPSRIGIDEINVAVVDAAEPSRVETARSLWKTTLGLGKRAVGAVTGAVTTVTTAVGNIRMGTSGLAKFRANTVAKARAEYQDHPTRYNRLKYVAIAAGGLMVTAGGAILAYRAAGSAIDGVGHLFGAHDGGAATPEPTHSHPHGSTSEATPSATTPSAGESAATAEPATDATTPPAGNEGATNGAGILPDGTTLPDTLPDGVTLSHENTEWLKGHTGGGEVGAYDASHLPADGTGYEGTIWHTALDSLKQLGYDVSHMTPKERDAYVDHVLALNHKDPESAKHIGDGFEVIVPTNADAIELVTKITGSDGHPLMPTHGSIAEQHINAIRVEIQTQVLAERLHDAADAGSNAGNPGHGATTATTAPDRDPGVSPTPTDTTHPTTNPTTTHPTTAAAPSATTTTTVVPPITEGGSHSESHAPWWAYAGAATGMIGVTGLSGALIVRRHKREEHPHLLPFEAPGAIPEFISKKASAEKSDDDPDDDEGGKEKPTASGAAPRVRPQRPPKS